MLAILILNTSPNVNFITFKFSSTGELSPNSWPYASHDKKSTCDASSPK